MLSLSARFLARSMIVYLVLHQFYIKNKLSQRNRWINCYDKSVLFLTDGNYSTISVNSRPCEKDPKNDRHFETKRKWKNPYTCVAPPLYLARSFQISWHSVKCWGRNREKDKQTTHTQYQTLNSNKDLASLFQFNKFHFIVEILLNSRQVDSTQYPTCSMIISSWWSFDVKLGSNCWVQYILWIISSLWIRILCSNFIENIISSV